ncbi:hypothetical protein JOQ06_022362, partial [Pogonophryne albipinna]
VEKEACESKLSKLRLQSKAKVTSLNAQLEELKKQHGGQGTPTHGKKGSSEGEQASRGKIVLLKKKVEELEHQLAKRQEELEKKSKEVEFQRQRGEEIDMMLTEKDRKLAEKEEYIVHLQSALSGDQPITPAPQQQVSEEGGAMQDLQLLVQSLTRKVGEAEERYSLLQEQRDSFRELLDSEKEQYTEKENMFKQNIQTFKDIIIQKDNLLTEINQIHEQELFKLAAKSDASADIEQLLKALKQKLYEKEEVLLGKTQVINVLQQEVDGRDQQIKELTERFRRLHVERESLESKMEAEKHVMRAQLRDLMEKQQAEVQRVKEELQEQLEQTQQEIRRSAAPPTHREEEETGSDSASNQRIAELEGRAKKKTDEASRSETKFLKMKAWSKTRIRQLEEELKKSQAGGAPPDLNALRSRITALEEEREENLWKVEQYEELKAKNETLEAKLEVYEEQQRTLQADLEQFTKRTASQASESGSADDTQSHVLEWQEMVSDAVSARDRAKEEKAAMVLRISHMEEEREGMGAASQNSFPSVLCMQAPPTPPVQRVTVLPAASPNIHLPLGGGRAAGRTVTRCTFICGVESASPPSSPNTIHLSSAENSLLLASLHHSVPPYHFITVTPTTSPPSINNPPPSPCGTKLIEDDWFFPGCSDPALASRQQELEEELTQARGLGHHRSKKLSTPAQRSLQEDFEFEGQIPFQDPRSPSESTTQMEGENMGGWWPEFSSPDTDGLRSVVEELELERNQLQEQILSLEERCQHLEDRLQLQARIETLQNESERLQSQLSSVRSQQSRDTEKHQLLVSSLNEQLKGLSNTQECLESSLIEKENTLAKTSEKLELINGLRESLSDKETQYKDVSDKLLQTELTLENVSQKCSVSEKQCSELKSEVIDVTQKLSVLKEKAQKQEVTIETLQSELDQTNEELDKLNSAHLEERAQLIHDLQSCEREIDRLKDVVLEKDEEISTLSGNMAEYAEQVTMMKQDIKLKDETLVRVETALSKVEREAMILRESQTSEQKDLDGKITELVEKLKDTEMELLNAKKESECKVTEVEHLIKQTEEDKITIQDLRGEIQKQIMSQRNHLTECETHIASLQEQLTLSTQKQQESEALLLQLKDKNTSSEQIQQQLNDKEQKYEKELKSSKEEQNKLLAQVEKYNHEMQTLSKQLEVQVQSEEHIKKDIQEKLETIATLENKLKSTDKQAEEERQNFNTEMQNRDSEKEKLSNELESKSENISKLRGLLKTMKSEKKQLQDKLKGLTEELELQKQNANELNGKVTSALELNSSLENQVDCLTKEKERLEMEVTESVKSISEVSLEKDSLQAKVSTLETQHSQNNALIEELQRAKEDLTHRSNELNKVLEQSTHSTSEVLLAKTNECSNLSQLLREREDKVTHLQEEVQSVSSKVEQLQQDMAEKDQVVIEHRAQIETQQNQQTQLQETVSLLREQKKGLKSGLMEKDTILKEKQEGYDSLQSEITQQKDIVSKLQAEAESQNVDHLKLRTQIEEKEGKLKQMTQQCQKQKDKVNDANKSVKSLSEQIRVLEEKAGQLEAEAERRQMEIASLNGNIQAIREENQQLRAACESREMQLSQQTQLLSELDGRLKATLEKNSSFSVQISSLTENNQRLQEELAQNIKSVSELATERKSLQEQNSGLEMQISEKQKIIEVVLNEKEMLTVAGDELKKILRESETSNSAGLLEKTSECANLLKTLRQREGQLQSLEEQLDAFKKQVSQQSSQLDAQQDQLLQLQDTISMLQEQGSVLKSGLMEKDKMLQQKAEESSFYQNEVVQQKALISQVQGEFEALRQECSEAKQQIEQKEKTLHNQKDELDKRSESVISLSGQLGAMNQSAAEAEVEITNLKSAVEKLTAENGQKEEQRKAEIIDFNDNIQALNEQNTRLKSEFQKTVAELSKAQDEVTHFKTAVCDVDNKLKTVDSEKDRLNLAMQEKHDLIQKRNSRISEQEEQLKRKEDNNVSLKAKVSELEESVFRLRGEVNSFSSESSILKTTLEKKEQSTLEYQSSSSAAVENLNSNLQAKEVECESLKEKMSHLEESITKLNSTLQVQMSEAKNLRKALGKKESALQEQSKSLQEIQRRSDEALLFKSQFMESTDLVSQLQNQIQLLSTESANLRQAAEETQSAFNNLQEKYSANLEELQDVRQQVFQRTDEVLNLRRLLDDTSNEHQTAKMMVETLRNDLSETHHKLQKTEELNSILSNAKDEAFASHQASVSLLTVEIDRLKSQHLQVVAQMNALTENVEQREMALHAINSQYTSQAKHASQLVSEMQKLEQQNKRLNEEISLSKNEQQKLLTAVSNENTHLQEEVRKHLAEKEGLERSHHQILASQVQMEQQSSSTKEKMTSEKESLQAKVSAKDEEVSQLKENIHRIEQILQDSEQEWLLVLDKEKQDRNILAEQLQSVENEMKSKDVKVNALKGDLDSLQEKLAKASSAIRQGSDQLRAKELEAAASRIQLEKVLASFQEKDNDNDNLQQALKAAEHELHKLVVIRNGTNTDLLAKGSADLGTEKASLKDMITQLQESHQSEVAALKHELDNTVTQLQNTQNTLEKGERSNDEKGQQMSLLQEMVEHLQTRLNAESEKVKEASVKHSSLHSDSQEKYEQINCLSIQISQQKELLAGLSQQLRDKDASIAQLIESASNERVKLGEEKSSLTAQLESMEQEHNTSTKKLEEMSQQLEEQMSSSHSEIDTMSAEKIELIKKNDDLKSELAKVSKEKDATKKKLQAALVVRKDLMKKIERYESQKEESENNKTEVSLLQDKLQEVNNQVQASAQIYEEHVSVLEKRLLEKEGEILEHKLGSERLVEQLQLEKQVLKATLNEKEVCLSETLQTLNEKSSLLEKLQSTASEREEAFDQEKTSWAQKLEDLQNEIKTYQDEIKVRSSSTSTAVDLENELAQIKLEKAKLQKKAQAALLARKETLKKAQESENKLTQELAELKDDYKAVLEQRCQQTNELNAVQLDFDEKVRELEELRDNSLSDLDELKTLRQLVEERDKTLQDLKMTLAEKESQCHSLSNLQKELEHVQSKCESMSLEMARKEEALVEVDQGAGALKSQLLKVEIDLEKAQAEVTEKTEEVEKYLETIRVAELQSQQEKQALLNENTSLETRLSIAESALEERMHANEGKYLLLMEENKALLENSNTLKAQVSEKEELIAALELQLQQQIKINETTIEKMRTESDEFQKSRDNGGKMNNQDNQSKVALLTRKLQAALLSRKELLKETAMLKEEVEKLSDKHAAKEADYFTLEASVLKLKQQNTDFESSVSSLNKERDGLRTDADGILNDNRSLSAACESLKLTIENITQQKQAFSCQLESLKDSQTDELTKWKSKHAELKQEYESLLQAYENVSSEMDKMRQLLEGAKRDRQEALRKIHKHESEMEILEKQAREMEEENRRIKEKMHIFSKQKRQKIEELEDENQKIRKELTELEENHKMATCEMTEKDQQLETEICRLKENLTEFEVENNQLSEKLEEASCSLEVKHSKSNDYSNNMQLKLDEALSLNNSLTAQIESQKTELGAQLEMYNLLLKEKQHLSGRIVSIQNDQEAQLGQKDDDIKELKDIINRHSRETINLNEKVRILEDDKSLLQEELENVQEISDKVKNENEYLETVILKNTERIDDLIESVSVLQTQNKQLSSQLAEATATMLSVESERDQLALDMSEESKKFEDQLIEKRQQHIDEMQYNSYMENQVMLQQQIDDLKELKEKESQKVNELRQQLDSQHLQINTFKRSAETDEAKLSALSATPQGADASKLWNDLYQKTLHEKDNQLLEQGFVIKRFLDDMRVKDKEMNEVRVTKSRLERTLNEYSMAAAAQQRQLFIMSASNAEFSETAELMDVQVRELGAHAVRLEKDKNVLNRELADKEGIISLMQLNLQQLEKLNEDSDAQLLLLQSEKDKVQADFEKQEGLSLQLKTLLHSKDTEISSLLSCKDGQMSGYLEQLQTNYRTQVALYEDRLTSSRYQREKADQVLRGLEAKVKSLQIKVTKSSQEKEQMAAKMESFKNSMASLQSERERLMSEYRILEAKSQLSFMGRDGSADGEGGATKGLKHEIRKLLHQMDDLNSENAMLRAQLVRYREDLNQVLFLKDNQLKILLKKQQDVIKDLESQKAAAEKQQRESQLELQKEEEASNTFKAEILKLTAHVSNLEADVVTLKKEKVSTNKGKVISDLQEAVAAKAAECNDLQQRILSQKLLNDELKEKMQLLEKETEKSLGEAEDKYNSELDAFEREVVLMRNERETADGRVADLAKDLLEMEQQLSEAKTQSKNTKAQNESMVKAMVALQDDRDQLIEDFKVLRNRYDEELRETQAALNNMERSLQDATSDLAMVAKERDILVQKLKALENKDAHAELSKLLDDLSKELSEKERDFKQVVQENNTFSRQLSAFSRSMASLQNDRERLMDDLTSARKEVESRQGSSPESVSVDRSKGSVLQNEREAPQAMQKMEKLQQTTNMHTYGQSPEKEIISYQEETANLRSDTERRDTLPVKESVVLAGGSGWEEVVRQLEAERVRLHGDLQRCMYEIQQRDLYLQQLNTKLQQAMEEKGGVSAQLRAVSQTLRDTQTRCHWLESQVQNQAQGAVFAEVAPGAPQERSNNSMMSDTAENTQLQERLLELEQSLTDERSRRETAEEALRLAEDRAKSVSSSPRDFNIEMETEEEWEALSLNPNQPLITRKVKGGVVACRRWIRGRSLYFSRLLTSRARSRHLFLFYLLSVHLLLLMCLTGAL